MELQHINVKIHMAAPAEPRLDESILIFHRWIREKKTPEMLIDVADYAHVPLGPGVMVIGHEASYSIDIGAENRPGLLYNAKVKREGANADRIAHALGQAVRAADLLEQDELWKGKVKFQTDEIEIVVNDRLLAPNDPSTYEAVKGDIDEGIKRVLGANDFSAEYAQGDSRRRFTVIVRCSAGVSVGDLASAVGA